MTKVIGRFVAVDGFPTEGTITARSLELRPGKGVAITGEPRTSVIRAGAFAIDDVAPGPVLFTIAGQGVTHDARVTVPDRGSVEFVELLEAAYEYEPEVVSRVLAAVREATVAARGAHDAQLAAEDAQLVAEHGADTAGSKAREAGESASAAQEAASSAGGSAGEAKQAAQEARGAKAAAAEASASAVSASEQAKRHAQAAETARGVASEAADKAVAGADRVGDAEAVLSARDDAETARDDARSAATQAGDAASRANSSANAAKSEADRAKSVVDQASEGLTPAVTAALSLKADKQHKHVSADITDATSQVGFTSGDAGRLVKIGDDRTFQVNDPTYNLHVANKRYVDAGDSALDAKKSNKDHKHSPDDLTRTGGASGAANSLVMTNAAGMLFLKGTVALDDSASLNVNPGASFNFGGANVRIDPPKTGRTPANKDYVDAGDARVKADAEERIKRGSTTTATARVGAFNFMRVGNLVTVRIYNGAEGKKETIPAGFLPADNPAYFPVTYLGTPVQVALLNVDGQAKEIGIERAPGTAGLVHGSATYVTTDPWPN